MSWLINLIRGWFCKHEIEVVSGAKHRETWSYVLFREPTKVFYCKKCGYNKQRWC